MISYQELEARVIALEAENNTLKEQRYEAHQRVMELERAIDECTKELHEALDKMSK